MYKNQLQELAQRSCFNLPCYTCMREGPDHAPRFKASVNFNGEIFEGTGYCSTLRQAEHAAAEVALNTLSTRGPSKFLAARVLDETGVYKNLLQGTAHRAGLNLPVYTTVRSGPGHSPVFTCIVEVAGMNFTGEPAKTKKQAEKNAAMAAWSALKQCKVPNLGSLSQTPKETESNEEQERVVIARILSNFRTKDENKSTRHRHQQSQIRRKVIVDYIGKSSSSSSHNALLYNQYRPLDLLSNFSSVKCQQQNCSKILPPMSMLKQSEISSQEPSSSINNTIRTLHSLNKSIPVQIRSKSDVSVHEVKPPLEEHQKDEEEWLYGQSNMAEKATQKDPKSAIPSSVFMPKTIYPRPDFMPYTSNIKTMLPDKNIHTQMRIGPSRTPTMINCGDLNGIAPAVHIRSVIPVCAAPPMRPSLTNLLATQNKETSTSTSASPRTEEEISGANLKLNKLQL